MKIHKKENSFFNDFLTFSTKALLRSARTFPLILPWLFEESKQVYIRLPFTTANEDFTKLFINGIIIIVIWYLLTLDTLGKSGYAHPK